MKNLSKLEIKNLLWAPGEKFALVNRETKEIFIGSDTKKFCEDALIKMTPKHPKYDKLQLVEKPEPELSGLMIIDNGGLKCDNPKCDWTDKTITLDNYKDWLNVPCPKCGENVLTEEDYTNSEIMRLSVKFIQSMSSKELEAFNKMTALTPASLKEHPMFKGAKGLNNLDEKTGEVVMTISTHKEIKVEEIKKV